MTTREEFVAELAAERILRDWSQSRVAEMLGTSLRSVSRWEDGQAFPAEDMLRAWAALLELPVPDGVSTPVAGCGTNAGYHRHLYRREVTCRACCAAHTAAVTAWSQRRETSS